MDKDFNSLFEMVKEEQTRRARADLVNNLIDYINSYIAITGASIIHNDLDSDNIDVRFKRVEKKLIGTLGDFKSVITPDDYLHIGEFIRESVQDCTKMLHEMARNRHNPEFVRKVVIKDLLSFIGGDEE